MCIHLMLPEEHYLRYPALAMLVDTVWEVGAKVTYCKVIIEAHMSVFAVDMRTMRKLNELKHLMSVLWVSSSDVVVICTEHDDGRITAIFSPSFLTLVGKDSSTGGVVENQNGKMSTALVVELDPVADWPNATPREAYYVGK